MGVSCSKNVSSVNFIWNNRRFVDDDVHEFKGVITSTEFLAKDIYERICVRLKNDYLDDYHQLHKIKITLTESNVAWASFEQEID